MKNMFDQLPWLELAPANKVYDLLYKHALSDNAMLLVTGSDGAGKTRMLRQLSQNMCKLKNTWIASVDGACDDPEHAIVAALGNSDFSVTLSTYDSLVLLLKQRKAFSQKTVLLIDNAEKLSEKTLGMLNKIGEFEKENKPHKFKLSIIFFSSPKVHWLSVSAAVKLRYSLPPLSSSQIKNLAEHAYSYMGINRGFSEAEVSIFYNTSHGYPGQLLEHIASSRQMQKGRFTPAVKSNQDLYKKAVTINEIKANPNPQKTGSIPENAEDKQRYLVKKEIGQRSFSLKLYLLIGLILLCMLVYFVAKLKDLKVGVLLVQDQHELERASEDANLADINAGLSLQNSPDTPEEIEDKYQTVNASHNTNYDVVAANVINDNILNDIVVDNIVVEAVAVLPEYKSPVESQSLETIQDSKPKTNVLNPTFYVIKLSKGNNIQAAKAKIKDIPVPGKAQLAKIKTNEKIEFITYIGPYGSKSQAQSGLERLPMSLKALKPIILANTDLIK